MSQFCEFEIVSELLKEPNHVRGLAIAININRMSIHRTIKFLVESNVLDFSKNGNNKRYFIKKTAEAKTYVFMAEYYKLVKTLKKYPHLRIILDTIQNNNKIDNAILFGSYSKGIAKNDSDIDIYINTTDESIKKDVKLINTKISVKIGTYDKSNLLIKEIEKNHVIIKGVEQYYENSGFFK